MSLLEPSCTCGHLLSSHQMAGTTPCLACRCPTFVCDVAGAVLFSARSRSGRLWRVRRYETWSDHYVLDPLGDDVSSARSSTTGRWQGGPRTIMVPRERLGDERFWMMIS